jgi:4-hydroxy-3-methylbut-2-enyl diphosphate reductase
MRVNDASEIPDDLFGIVGVTAGASAPEELVEAVIARLNPRKGARVVKVTEESEYFPPPPELRDLVRKVRPNEPNLLASDAEISAATVLASLSQRSNPK